MPVPHRLRRILTDFPELASLGYKRPQIHRADANQATIVEGLRERGYRVEIIGHPCDWLVIWRHNGGPFLRLTLECKIPANKKLEPLLDKRQREQARFCQETDTPYVVTLEQALAALTAYQESVM